MIASAASSDHDAITLVNSLKSPESLSQMISEGNVYRRVITSVEKTMLQQVLAPFKGNYLKTAAALGISRATLRKKLREFRIESQNGPTSLASNSGAVIDFSTDREHAVMH